MTATIETGNRRLPFDALANILTFGELVAIILMVNRETPRTLVTLPVTEIVPKVSVVITGRADCWMRVSKLVHEYADEILLSP